MEDYSEKWTFEACVVAAIQTIYLLWNGLVQGHA